MLKQMIRMTKAHYVDNSMDYFEPANVTPKFLNPKGVIVWIRTNTPLIYTQSFPDNYSRISNALINQ